MPGSPMTVETQTALAGHLQLLSHERHVNA